MDLPGDLLNRAALPMAVRIPTCPACGEEHTDVPVKSLTTAQPPFTHWFSCPVNGDPVPMSLLMVDDKTAVAVHNRILQAVVQCLVARRYLIAFFRVEQGRIYCDPPIFDEFPTGDFGRAIGLLYAQLKVTLDRQDLDIPAEHGLLEQAKAPMPTAPALLPKVKLFGEE